MADDFRSYTLDVDLEKMPGGWLLFAIGEGKPVIAPPPVMDEIKELRSKLDAAEQERDKLLRTIAEHVTVREEYYGRLSRLQTALQRIVDGRFLGYVEAQEIARGALDGDIAVESRGGRGTTTPRKPR